MNADGYIRGTRDLDLVPDSSEENLSRLANVIDNPAGRVEIEGRAVAPHSTLTVLRTGDWIHVTTPRGDFDVLQGIGNVPTYRRLINAAETAEVEGVEIKVCSLDDLIEMKRASERLRDRDDLEALEAIRADRANGQS